MLAARAEAVNGARQQLFAGSGFALDEDRCIGWRNSLDLPQHIAQARAFAHDVVEPVFDVDLFFKILLFLFEPVAQLRNAPECHGVIDGHRHLSGDLDEHLGFALPKCALLPADHGECSKALPW